MRVAWESYVRVLGALMIVGGLSAGCGASGVGDGAAGTAESVKGGVPASGTVKDTTKSQENEAGSGAVTGPIDAAGGPAPAGGKGKGKVKVKDKATKGMGKGKAGTGGGAMDDAADTADDMDEA